MKRKIGLILSLFLLVLSNSLLANNSWESLNGPKNIPMASFLSKSPSNQNTIYAGSLGIGANHLYKTINGGKTWDKTTPIFNSGMGFFTRAYVSPSNSDIVYALAFGFEENDSSPVNIFLSENGGNSWQKVESKVSNSDENFIITDLAIDPKDPKTIYATSTNGILKSDNSGKNWIGINNGIDLRINSEDKDEEDDETYEDFKLPIAIEVSHKNPNILYASLGTDLYKSVNHGVKWEKISKDNNKFIYQIVLDPSNHKNIYTMSLSFKDNSDEALIKAIKLASKFKVKNKSLANSLSKLIEKEISKKVAKIFTSNLKNEENDEDYEDENNTDFSLMTIFSKSTDSGNSFTDIDITNNQKILALFIDINFEDPNKLIVSGLTEEFKTEILESNDQAKSFKKVNLNNFNDIALNPIYTGVEGNILLGGFNDFYYGDLKDSNINVNIANSKFINSIVFELASYENPNEIYLNTVYGLGFNQLYKLENKIFSKIDLPNYDDFQLPRVHFGKNSYYVGVDGDFYKKNQENDHWALVSTVFSNEGESHHAEQLLVIPETDTIFVRPYYSLINHIFRSKDSGNTWEKLEFSVKDDNYIEKMVYNKTNKSLYITTNRGLYISKDEGQSFTKVMGVKKKDSDGISEILISENNPNMIYILLDNNIYKSEDGGKKWNLIRKLIEDKNFESNIFLDKNSDRIYIFTPGKDIEYSDDNGANWNNLPSINGSIFSIIYPTKNFLYAGTAGSGLYQISN